MRSMPILTAIVLLIGIAAFGCSSRQSYQPRSDVVELSPDAVNINTATADEIEKLPHIGDKTAEAIVQFRTENGPFRRPENLLQIHGISERRFAEIRQLIKTE
jgi:competence ComEA-like helix-hairpin-helix protein